MIGVDGDAPLRVAVLVDLVWGPQAGGHVKCWERLAQAAVGFPEALDLTVHYSGERAAVHPLAPNVRYRIHAPVFSTRRLPFLSVPDHTDLAPFHPGLWRALGDRQLVHTTDAYFAFSATAAAWSRWQRRPLVTSIHTDTPQYSRLFCRKTIEGLLAGGGVRGTLRRLLLDRLRVDAGVERSMRAKLAFHQHASAFSLVSHDDDYRRALGVLPPERIGRLRRGVDKALFNPARRDRQWLAAEFGVPADRVLVLAVGRVNVGKRILVLAEAVRQAVASGQPVHLLCAGEGEERTTVQALLGERATCPGALDPEQLARVYACADLFAMPSEIEVFANAVMEALASGVPVLVAERGGMGRIVHDGVTGLILAGEGPLPWSGAIEALARAPERRLAMAAAARAYAERELPSWADVLAQDLLPLWRAACGGPGRPAGNSG